MPITFEWVNTQKNIIMITYIGNWNWKEFDQCNRVALIDMMNSVSHTVHLIHNLLPSGNLPLGGALTHGRNAVLRYPSNWGILVMVIDSHSIRMMGNVFCRMVEKTYMVKTVDEAQLLIAQVMA